MLSFSDYRSFEDFINELRTNEQNSTIVRNAFLSLGIDIDLEQTTNITDYPVCRITENGFSGFLSSRRIEENAINASLNSGGDAFTIIDNVYLKTALNSDNSVHIGTRIFKFYDNGGVAIVLNNDWTKYNTIKNLSYENLKQGNNLIVTNDVKNSWTKIYNFSTSGNIDTEKSYFDPDINTSESVLFCDFSDNIEATNLSDGTIRIELPYVGQAFDLFEWTFSDGTKAYGNPLIINCGERTNGTVTLDVFVLDSTVPNGKRRICTGSIDFLCNCGEKKSIRGQLIRTINGETWRIQASMWVRSGEVGCENSYRRRRGFLWVPAYNRGVRTDMNGTYKRELEDKSCIDVQASGSNALGEGTFPTQISVRIPDVDKIFREPNLLTSGHSVNVSGTWFGFGIGGVPRLILN